MSFGSSDFAGGDFTGGDFTGGVDVERREGWLSREDLESVRGRMPILYVDAVPIRVDGAGTVTSVGLLLRARDDGTIARELVSGRVLYHERVRDALMRHLEKDLGPEIGRAHV